MTLLTKFQEKWITFGCATAKSYFAVMYYASVLFVAHSKVAQSTSYFGNMF